MATVFEHACRLGAEGIVSRGRTVPIDPVHALSGSRSAIPQVSRCSGSGARCAIDEPSSPRQIQTTR